MKKKVLSFALMLALVVGMMVSFSLTASAAPNYEIAHATAVSETNSDKYDQIYTAATTKEKARVDPKNALGAPDATRTAGDNFFTGLRYFSEATYTFDDLDVDGNLVSKRLIANYRGDNEDEKPDLSLIEVTWIDTWHVEAVDVYLVGAVTVHEEDGREVYSPPSATPLKIGTAFNRVGIAKGTAASANAETGMVCKFEEIDNFGYTHIYFPDNIAYAQGVQLKDQTTEYNNPKTANSYNDNDEGFDLDALTAWYTIQDGELESEFSFVKGLDLNGDGQFDEVGVGFWFDLYMFDGADWALVGEAESDITGMVTFEELDTGSYKVVERLDPAYTLLSYVDGLYFNVVGDDVFVLNKEEAEGEDEMFLNQSTYEPEWSSDTSWAGYVTDKKAFPMHNKSKFAVAPQGNVQRSGQTNWAMVMLFNGEETGADIVMGQNTDIGDISVKYDAEAGGFVVSGQLVSDEFAVTHVHADVSGDLNRFTNANGNGNFAVNAPVEAVDGAFSFVIPGEYTEGLTYVGIHMESARDLNYANKF